MLQMWDFDGGFGFGFFFSIWVTWLDVCIFISLSVLFANILGNFAQQQFLSPVSQYTITLCNFVSIELIS